MKKKPIAVLLTLLLALSMVLGACSQGGGTPSDAPTGSESSNVTEANKNGTREITDMAGRKVTIPAKITKVMGAANPDGMMLYTIDPDLLMGWTSEVSDGARKYMDAKYADLPKITGVSIWEPVNKEEILSLAPDFILAVVDIKNVDISMYDKVQTETGVPIVLAEATLSELGKTYDFLGELLNKKDVTDKLSAYVIDLLADVAETNAKVPEADRVHVYYGCGKDGLSTAPITNWHGEFIQYADGFNVTEIESDSGHATVSMEQVLNWNPAVIIESITGASSKDVFSQNAWQEIKAVKDHKVYTAPLEPFNWVDKPTSVNRLIGVKWLNSLLYPDKVNYDLKADLKEFYDLFYHYQLTDSEVTTLMDTQTKY